MFLAGSVYMTRTRPHLEAISCLLNQLAQAFNTRAIPIPEYRACHNGLPSSWVSYQVSFASVCGSGGETNAPETPLADAILSRSMQNRVLVLHPEVISSSGGGGEVRTQNLARGYSLVGSWSQYKDCGGWSAGVEATEER